MSDRVVDVIGVGDAGHDSFGTVFQHVGVSIELVRFAPRSDGGVLGSRNAVRGAFERILRSEIGGIILREKLNGGRRVRAAKIPQMCRTANGRAFLATVGADSRCWQLD